MTWTDVRTSATRFGDRLVLFFATGCFISYLPAYFVAALPHRRTSEGLQDRKWTGAGLVGSLWGALTCLLLPPSLRNSWILIVIAIGVSVWVGGRAEKLLRTHDDPRIVIDEWVGVWVALWMLGTGLDHISVVAVVLFRFFDVWKGPWGRAAQKLPGGWGVTVDDVLAGIAANVSTRLLYAALPFIFPGRTFLS